LDDATTRIRCAGGRVEAEKNAEHGRSPRRAHMLGGMVNIGPPHGRVKEESCLPRTSTMRRGHRRACPLARIFHGGRGMMADELRVAWCGQRGANSRSYSRARHAPGGMQIAASTRVGPDPNWKPRPSTKDS